MNKKETISINHKDGHLWWNASTIMDIETVLPSSPNNLEQIEVILDCMFHYGLCMASAEIVVAHNKEGLFTIMTPFADTMGNGSVYCSILPGFCFKDVYCYSPEFEANEIIIAKDKDDCWGAIEISRNSCLWANPHSFMMPTLRCRFDHERMDDVLKVLKIEDCRRKTSSPHSVFVRLIGLKDPGLNALSDDLSSLIYQDYSEILLPPQRHLSLSEKVSRCKALLRHTHEPKIEELIKYLEKMGYFIAPGSKNHHRFYGGLVSHSLEVFDKAMKLRNRKIREGISPEAIPVKSVIISALLHDVCKADLLRFDESQKKVIEIKRGMGHSDRSVRQIGYSGFSLTPLEKDAILWHMGRKRRGLSEKERAIHFANYPLSDIINKADGRSIEESKKRHHSKVSGKESSTKK